MLFELFFPKICSVCCPCNGKWVVPGNFKSMAFFPFLFLLGTYFHKYNYIIEFIYYGVRVFVKVGSATSLVGGGKKCHILLVLFIKTTIYSFQFMCNYKSLCYSFAHCLWVKTFGRIKPNSSFKKYTYNGLLLLSK